MEGHEQLHSSVGLHQVDWTREWVTRRNGLDPAEKKSSGPEHNIRLSWMRSGAMLLTKLWR